MKTGKNKLFLLLLLLTMFSYTFSDTNSNSTTSSESQTENNFQSEDIKKQETSQENIPDVQNDKTSTIKNGKSGKKPSKAASTFKKKEINNSLWRLTSILDKDLTTEEYSEEKKIIITLYLAANGGINGVVGDEGYFGHYRLNGNDISISLLGSSLMGEESSEIGAEYLDTIKKVSRIELDGGTLTLKSSSGNLVFQRVK